MAEIPILVELFKHNAWANERLLEACVTLEPAQLALTVPGTYGSIRETLVHLLAAQERFLALLGQSLDGPPLSEQGDRAALDELRDRAKESGKRLVLVAQRSGNTGVVQGVWRGEPFTIPVSILLTQALTHATEHRAQVATIMGAHGIRPPALDAWSYGPPELWRFR
jgi:uncharacterized damage-inducible protein DinB